MNLESLLLEKLPEWPAEVRKKLVSFYELLLRENDVQNLTRITSAEDFFYSNVLDVQELLATQWISYPALDIGSGGGVPGLMAALVGSEKWILTDSEGKKAEFLKKAALELGISHFVEVFSGRAEDYLRGSEVPTLVARAVGPVERIYGWVRKAQGWSRLILLKGPAWDEEWARFQKTKHAQDLKLEKIHNYIAGPEQKTRKIVLLTRVPRGTQGE